MGVAVPRQPAPARQQGLAAFDELADGAEYSEDLDDDEYRGKRQW